MKALELPPVLNEASNTKLKREFTLRMGERLKKIRRSKKLTQQQLAEKAGLHLTYVGHLELGKYHPTTFIMWKIAKSLGVSLDDIVGD